MTRRRTSHQPRKITSSNSIDKQSEIGRSNPLEFKVQQIERELLHLSIRLNQV